MIEIGNYNRLTVVKRVGFGLYLDGGNEGEILLPTRYVPDGLEPGDAVEVFIYHDNEGRLIATTARPYATVGQCAWMTVRDVSAAGAFLDWGIMKDLLVPHREQKAAMRPGRRYLVYVYLDHVTRRVVASARIDRFLDNLPPDYERNQQVGLIVADETEMGYKVVVDHRHWGLVYRNEVFRSIAPGQVLTGYVKNVRDDDKIDISLTPLGYENAIEPLEAQLLEALRHNRGRLALHDGSDAAEITALLGCSKKSFKKAVGALYRRRLIALEPDGIRLLAPDEA